MNKGFHVEQVYKLLNINNIQNLFKKIKEK